MLTFKHEDHKVTIEPGPLMIKEIRELYQADKTKNKSKAILLLTYVHLVSQIDETAPYYNAPYNEIREIAAKNIFTDDNMPKDLLELEPLIEEYKKAYATPAVRIAKSFDKKIEQIMQELDRTSPEIVKSVNKGSVSFVSNMPMVSKIMLDMTKLLDEREKLEQRIKKKTVSETSVLGGKKPSRLEKRT